MIQLSLKIKKTKYYYYLGRMTSDWNSGMATDMLCSSVSTGRSKAHFSANIEWNGVCNARGLYTGLGFRVSSTPMGF